MILNINYAAAIAVLLLSSASHHAGAFSPIHPRAATVYPPRRGIFQQGEAQRYIHSLTHQYLSSLSNGDDDNTQQEPSDGDFFDFLASKAADVNQDGSDADSNPDIRQRRRDKMRQFLSNRLGGIVSGSAYLTSDSGSGGDDMVQPIRLDEPSASAADAGPTGPADSSASNSDHPSDIAQIDSAVFQFKSDVRQRLAEQRQQEPNSVPVNAEQFLDRVIEEVREYNLAEAREKRAQDDIRAYEMQQRQMMEDTTRDTTASEDPLVMEILGEAKGNADAVKVEEAEVQSFREYERALREQMENADIGTTAADGEDVDEKALKIMQDLYNKRSEEPKEWDEDFTEWDTDNLEDGINEIKSAIEEKAKDAAGKKVRPEDMKEWVMYRSIATRMAEETGQDEVDEEDVKSQMERWKEFQAAEEEMRREAGLTKGARMPFPWVDRLESGDDDDESADGAPTSQPVDRRHPDDIRYDYDKQALQVLTDLMGKTTNPTRQEKLRGDIEALKVDLHELEKKIFERGPWTPPPEEPIEEELKGPVDISDIFGESPYVDGEEPSPSTYVGAPSEEEEVDNFAPPPGTPFFSDSFQEDAAVDEELPATPLPDTPFFRDSGEDDDSMSNIPDIISVSDDSENSDEDVKSLGSLEEQQFRSMTRRAGVRSQAGEEELKKQWDAYLEAEQAMRDKTGLSGGDDPALLRSNFNYDVDAVVKEGGDIDADAILASIGQRPSKKNKSPSEGGGNAPSLGNSISEETDDGYQQFLKYEQERAEQARQAQEAAAAGVSDAIDSAEPTIDSSSEGNDDDDVIVYHKHSTTWDKTSISDQLYRSLTPEGSLRDDPGAKEKDKAAFEEYLKKEQEMRNQVESMDVPKADVMGKVSFSDENERTESSEEFIDLDKVDSYVDNALDSIGPRPEVRKRSRGTPDNVRDYTDMRSGDMDGGENEEDDENVPEWVKMERLQEADRKKAAFDASADDAYLDELDYEEKERQAIEFERETSTSAEIDIGEIIGRDYYGPGDESDDDFYSLDKGRGSSTFSSFEKRKKTLLEYTELSVAELNSLIEYKEAESVTGASRYLKKVRQPYREFGAIFRLEGLLVDITGLQWEAWKTTAEKHELEMPTLEEVRTASAHRAAYAIQRIFYWSDDIFEVRDIAKTHEDAVKEVFSQWMAEQGVTYTPSQGPKSFDLFGVEGDGSSPDEPVASSAEALPVTSSEPSQSVENDDVSEDDIPQPSEADYIGMQFRSWKKAAEAYGYADPTVDEMQVAMYTGPEEGVQKAFGWTSDHEAIVSIVSIYRDAFRQETDLWAQQHQPEVLSKLKKQPTPQPSQQEQVREENSSSDGLSTDDVAEMQLFAWSTAAEKHGYAVPSLEDIQLASWVSPDEAVQRVYGWTDDFQEIQNIASTYREAMKKISDIYIKKKNLQVAAAAKTSAPQEETPRAPTQDDIMRLQLEAWTQTAQKFGHDAPLIDDIQPAAFAGPDGAVRKVFKWTDDAEKVNDITSTYKEIAKTLSQELMRRFGQGAGSVPASASSSSSESNEEANLPLFEFQDGSVDWIESLLDVEMPCAVVSHLDQELLDVILEQTGLDRLFPQDRRVSASNFYASQSQEFLGAALRLERRPDYCAVFDTTPSSSAAAHQVDMQSISRIGSYKNYDLLSADITFKYFTQLQTQVLRGLFTETKLDEPQTEIQDIKPETKTTTTKTRFWEEGDR